MLVIAGVFTAHDAIKVNGVDILGVPIFKKSFCMYCGEYSSTRVRLCKKIHFSLTAQELCSSLLISNQCVLAVPAAHECNGHSFLLVHCMFTRSTFEPTF